MPQFGQHDKMETLKDRAFDERKEDFVQQKGKERHAIKYYDGLCN